MGDLVKKSARQPDLSFGIGNYTNMAHRANLLSGAPRGIRDSENSTNRGIPACHSRRS
jgi:hypothetical protein